MRQKPEGNEAPRDAQFVALLLKSLGIESCEPGVIPQLMELIFRYSTDILSDAQIYCEHAGRNGLSVEDVRLAIQNRTNFSFTSPPSREMLMEMAAKKNAQPLPLIPESFGITLPQERHCLLSLNYKVIPSASKMSKLHQKPKISTQSPVTPGIFSPTTPTAMAPVSASAASSQQKKSSFVFDVTGTTSNNTPSSTSLGKRRVSNDNDEDDDYDNMDLDDNQ